MIGFQIFQCFIDDIQRVLQSARIMSEDVKSIDQVDQFLQAER